MKNRKVVAHGAILRKASEPKRNVVFGENGIERRRKIRFPFTLDVRYRTLSDGPSLAGTGHTVNMSRSGLLIESEHEVPTGARVEVTIEWPVCLDGTVGLQLVTSGRVARSSANKFVLLFRQYEFRTMKRKPPSASGLDSLGNSMSTAAGA